MIRRFALVALLVLALASPAGAQSWIYSAAAEKAIEALLVFPSSCCIITNIYGTGGSPHWVWPTIDGAAGDALITNGAGVLSFSTATAVTGGGTATHLARWTAVTTLGDATVTETSGALASVTTMSMSGQLTSTLATGTAPFAISSATLVPTLYVARAALADTTTTNANLTGPITSVGNATSIASQTGTGTKFVVDTSPTLVTPNIGVATATSVTTPSIVSSASDITIAPSTSSLNISATLQPTTGDSGNLGSTGKYWSETFTRSVSSRNNGVALTVNGGTGGIVLTVAANTSITNSGYSVTGSGTSALASLSGTLNTSGVTHVFSQAITVTAAGAGSTVARWLGGAAGATALFSIGTGGALIANSLTAASGTPNSVCINATTHEITENAALTCTVSSRRFKNSIHDQDMAWPILASLTPREFRMNDSPAWRVGFIAEEVDQVDSRLVAYDPQGRPHSVRYEDITSILTKGLQELEARVRALETR